MYCRPLPSEGTIADIDFMGYPGNEYWSYRATIENRTNSPQDSESSGVM